MAERGRSVLPEPPGPPGAAQSSRSRLVHPPGACAYSAFNHSPGFHKSCHIGSPGPSSTNGTTVVSTAIRGRSLRGGSVLGVTADRSRGVGARTRAAASEARRSLESATLAPRSLERFPPERMPSSATCRSLAHLKGHGGHLRPLAHS